MHSIDEHLAATPSFSSATDDSVVFYVTLAQEVDSWADHQNIVAVSLK